jgi:hypothetical protein
MVDADPENWSLEAVAAALRVAIDDLETFERAGADLLSRWCRDDQLPHPGERAARGR